MNPFLNSLPRESMLVLLNHIMEKNPDVLVSALKDMIIPPAVDPFADIPENIRAVALDNKVLAVKLYRELTGCSLLQGKTRIWKFLGI